jgi:hypothetical protein
MLGGPVLWLFLCSFLQLAASDAQFSLKFMTFVNPGGRQRNGKCCDVFCFSDCDHKFYICLDYVWGLISQRCYTSGKTSDRNSITFGSSIAGLNNPIVWKMSSWPGKVRVTIQVIDVDVNFDDEVDTIQSTILLKPNSQQSSAWLTIANRVRLTVEARVSCGQYYYGADCSVFCMPGNAGPAQYTCNQQDGSKTCATGWTGKDCNIIVNNCLPNKCQNGGTCHNLINSFTCSCPLGIKGRLCDQDLNECLNQDACSHGDCVNTLGSFACNCHAGYTGQKCEVNINECDSSPCQNGAKCSDRIGDFLCHCPAGFTGVRCDSDINECDNSSAKCRNGGVCVNTHGSHHCEC